MYWPVISPKGLIDKSSDKKIKEIQKQQAELEKKLTVEQLKPFELDKLIQEKEKKLQDLSDNLSKEQEKLDTIISETKSAKEKELKKYDEQISKLNRKKEKIEIIINSKQDVLKEITSELDNYGEKVSLKKSIENDKKELSKLHQQIDDLKKQVISYDDQINIESYGLYTPHYSFTSSPEYKEKLDNIRALQRSMIKNNKAGLITHQMLFNNSVAEGKKMQRENIKQLIRTFNVECEAAINKATISNMSRIEQRIKKSFETLNKLNERNLIVLSKRYLNLKLDELHLSFEYAQKKEEEKEILREEREKEKEERKVQAEIAKQRKAVEQERKKQAEHYKQAEALLKEKMQNVDENDEKFKSLQAEVAKLKEQLAELDKKEASLDYRENHSTAGYVYIISNIGAFGKNVFKIGVTRRLDPLARIKELSSASVPFKFDVHALIFSDDAYKLESNLHNYFDKYRVNKVNNRKEFFGITIHQVKDALDKYYNRTFDFHEIPEAEEYRKSLELMEREK
ncbi:DUF4041 domain-containing protein [Ligilactobacillus salivarius]|nr:DUF4041 domain-containing protein [Ligilactobacillus salivarius]